MIDPFINIGLVLIFALSFITFLFFPSTLNFKTYEFFKKI